MYSWSLNIYQQMVFIHRNLHLLQPRIEMVQQIKGHNEWHLLFEATISRSWDDKGTQLCTRNSGTKDSVYKHCSMNLNQCWYTAGYSKWPPFLMLPPIYNWVCYICENTICLHKYEVFTIILPLSTWHTWGKCVYADSPFHMWGIHNWQKYAKANKTRYNKWV